jgi:hypothetical protein
MNEINPVKSPPIYISRWGHDLADLKLERTAGQRNKSVRLKTGICVFLAVTAINLRAEAYILKNPRGDQYEENE